MRKIHAGLNWVLFVLPFGAALAQSPAANKPTPEPTFALDLKADTLGAYVAEVRRLSGDANIVIDGVGGVRLPPAHLRVTLALALEWIQQTAEAKSRGVILRTVRSGRDSSTVFVFTGPPPVDDRQVKPYTLSDDTGASPSADDVKTAVQNLLRRQHDTVEYDPKTGILTVAGPRNEIALVDQLMNAIAQSRRSSAPFRRLQAQVDSLRARVAELQAKGAAPTHP